MTYYSSPTTKTDILTFTKMIKYPKKKKKMSQFFAIEEYFQNLQRSWRELIVPVNFAQIINMVIWDYE